MATKVMALAAAAMALTIALPAAAQNTAVRSAHDAFAQGDYVRAERVLAAERRVFPNSPEVLINLAAVYARTGRVQQAASLYRRVLAREDVLLDLNADRTASAHMIAQTGLSRVGNLQTAAR